MNGVWQSTFIDLIIRLTLCRVYANNQSSKILTAEKLLGFAHKIIQALKDEENPLVIVGSKTETLDRKRREQYESLLKQRQEAPVIPLEILEQKYYFHKGLLMISFNRDQNREAKDSFIKALNIKPIYDVRIKKAAVEQLQKLYAAEGTKFDELEMLAQSFKHVSRDFIFLVNQSNRA